MTLAPVAEGLAVELSLPVLTSWVCRGWDSNTQPIACGANTQTTAPLSRNNYKIFNLLRHNKT